MTVVVAALWVHLIAVEHRRRPYPRPPGLPSFYSVPQPLPTTGAGTLLKSERLTVTGLHGVAYRVMYLSESVTDKPVPVTGLVIVPDKPAPDAAAIRS